MNDNEFYTFEDRAYIQPTVSSDEQEAFINNLRDVQARNNADIAQQTRNLGTDISSNLGGLGGGEAYFNSRYQTPQVNEMVDTLKAASQAEVAQDVMQNYQAQLKERYNQAARKAQQRQRASRNAYYRSLLGGNNSSNKNSSGWNGDIDMKEGGTTSTSNGGYFDNLWNSIYTKYGLKPKTTVPPKESDYQMTVDEYNQRLSEESGLPMGLIDPTRVY